MDTSLRRRVASIEMFRRIVPVLAIAILLLVAYAIVRQPASPAPASSGETRYWEPPIVDASTTPPTPLTLNPEISAYHDAVKAAGGRVYLVAKPLRETRFLNVRFPIPEDSIVVDGDVEYADIDFDEVAVRVMNPLGADATVPSGARDGRVIVVIPEAAEGRLSSFLLVKTYSQKRMQGSAGPVKLEAVSVFDVHDLTAGALSSVSLQVPATQSCSGNAMERTFNELPDWSPGPPLIVDGCSLNDCANAYAAWMRAYHDVGVVLQMLEYIANQADEDRTSLWDAPWSDQAGHHVPQTSLEYWFGEYADHRFKGLLSLYQILYERMQSPGVWTVPFGAWSLKCRQRYGGSCEDDWRAYHRYRGKIDLCLFKFRGLSNQRAKPGTLVHEALHYMTIPFNGWWIEDSHDHRHGINCNDVTRDVDGYDLCPSLHLAHYPDSKDYERPDGTKLTCTVDSETSTGCAGCAACNSPSDCDHADLAIRNNDTHGYATSHIGGGLRAKVSCQWPPSDVFPPTSINVVSDIPQPTALDPVETCTYSNGILDCSGSAAAFGGNPCAESPADAGN